MLILVSFSDLEKCALKLPKKKKIELPQGLQEWQQMERKLRLGQLTGTTKIRFTSSAKLPLPGHLQTIVRSQHAAKARAHNGKKQPPWSRPEMPSKTVGKKSYQPSCPSPLLKTCCAPCHPKHQLKRQALCHEDEPAEISQQMCGNFQAEGMAAIMDVAGDYAGTTYYHTTNNGMLTDSYIIDRGACYPTHPYFGGYHLAAVYNPTPHFRGYLQPRGYMAPGLHYGALPSHGYMVAFQVPSQVHRFGPPRALPNCARTFCPANSYCGSTFPDFI